MGRKLPPEPRSTSNDVWNVATQYRKFARLPGVTIGAVEFTFRIEADRVTAATRFGAFRRLILSSFVEPVFIAGGIPTGYGKRGEGYTGRHRKEPPSALGKVRV
jgi:hypothetical protein